MKSNKLPKDFYTREDVVLIAKELLGKFLFTNIDNELTGGIIVETEAYAGEHDRAAHSYGLRRTNRTEVMFREGGVAYVYLCYGIHHLFNVITNKENIPQAVLIRAIEPTDGIDTMMHRRNKLKLDHTLTAGPGAMSEALGIKTSFTQTDLNEDVIWIEDCGIKIKEKDIIASPRVGVDYAGEDAKLPWRFRIKDNKWTSRAK